MRIFLIGLPGCGKSTLGKEVAQLMSRTFVDLDEEIVRGEGHSVAQIFQQEGEANFRKIEKKYLSYWCEHQDDFIMATGGGTPCFLSNMELINHSGKSIFLDAPVNVIANRMMNTELARRPLFAGQHVTTIAGRIEDMRQQRFPFYERAHIILSGDPINAGEIVEAIQALEG